MSLRDKLNKLQKSLDINTYFPNYIHKPIFRVGFIVMIIFIISLLFAYGLSAKWVSVECDNIQGCKNPFIDCVDNYFSEPLKCDFYNSIECKGRNCNTELIDYKDYVGEKAPAIVIYSKLWLLWILASTLYVNHIYYLFRKRRKK